jgi:hypothetical protein
MIYYHTDKGIYTQKEGFDVKVNYKRDELKLKKIFTYSMTIFNYEFLETPQLFRILKLVFPI